jgi:hypothetical protein
MKWTTQQTKTFDGWEAKQELYPGFERGAKVTIVKMSGYPRIRYGVGAEAWSGRPDRGFTKTMDRTRTLLTYKGARKVASKFRMEIKKMWS